MTEIDGSGVTPDLPESLVDVAGRRIRDAILSGALTPGQKIVEETLCADLGISRAPVREALRLLAQQGLVEHQPRRGTRVAEWSPRDILQLFELRQLLERYAVESALPLADPDVQLAPVRAAIEAMENASADIDIDDAHRRFHAAVVGLADNRQLDIALEPILLKLQLPMAVNLRAEARDHHGHDDGLHRHHDILHALEANDIEAVVAALRDHGHLNYLNLVEATMGEDGRADEARMS
ncbi:GntR family transcriptional regulator [Gordonia sp. 852002-50816_SCH5313054-c]|uniref:GntR family transcriptional regulator n=1 Tax=Gordonia TaxID=2053 RepID=UPI0007EB1328|nr:MULTISPECIES: GntR family transcriptional regulator [unclassified Gordonia (in: high G+C Gram-positive bacteria)]OBC11478.1 GntR family transcriptional regulator [Gordonia sp. 852002-50816_SCH5313054-c]OBC20930.1 GntR family transcriptional regulator [Gordonia sp. 852002-50816_SCH5313054-a]